MSQLIVAKNKILFLLFLTLFFNACNTRNQYNSLELKTFEELKPIKNKNLAIAFGGGGVRGFMHLGVIKALNEEGIKADIVTGTSAGSIAATLYASGMEYEKIEELVLSMNQDLLTDYTIRGKGGIIQGKKLALWIQKITKNQKVEEAKIKLGISVTDLTNHKALLITKGDMGQAVQASSTVPGLFIPINSKGKLLVDGSVLSLVPVKFAKALGANITIAVDVFCGKLSIPKENIFDIMYTTNRMQICKISEYELKYADFIIKPKYEPNSYKDFKSKKESIKIGYEATKVLINDIKMALANKT